MYVYKYQGGKTFVKSVVISARDVIYPLVNAVDYAFVLCVYFFFFFNKNNVCSNKTQRKTFFFFKMHSFDDCVKKCIFRGGLFFSFYFYERTKYGIKVHCQWYA